MQIRIDNEKHKPLDGTLEEASNLPIVQSAPQIFQSRFQMLALSVHRIGV